MPAGKHGSSEITITIDGSPGGSPVDITQYVRTMGGAKIDNIQEPSHAFGDSWGEMLATGFRNVPPIPLTGFDDDTAVSGPHIVLKVTDADASPQGATRTLTLGFGNGRTFSGEVRLASYEVIGRNGQLSEFASVLNPTGAFVWA
jgi:hypothetical protein